jgi:hypothetical protein
MMTYLRSLIKRIVSGGYGAEDVNNHMLQGVFKQLLDVSTFSELLFPGAPRSVVENLPRNLRELLCWDLLSLDLANIAKKSASIFEGIKSKGEKRGDLMDATTEAILVPQIVEEAFARDVVETVRNLGRKVSGLNAKVVLSLAVPSEVESAWDQLDDGLPASLANPLEALAVQDEFLGGEWAALILADVRRFAAEEKMSLTSDGASAMFVPFAGDSGSAESKSKPDDSKKTVPTMAWIEIDCVEENYPALAQAIQQLHALPYEINGML